MLPPSPVEPTRDPQVTLPDLLEALLNRGVILHLDLIVAVADVPLIGVSLKAAVAGIETMLEYGMMRQWDEETRAWVQRSISRNVPFAEDEELIARMAGGHERAGFYTTWRPGTLYLTDRRFFVFRREPKEMLWETDLERIEALDVEPERSIGGDDRLRIRARLNDGSEVRISAAKPERMLTLLHEQIERMGRPRPSALPRAGQLLENFREGQMWYHEPRAGGPVWRGGIGRFDRRSGLTWKAPLDTRPAVALLPEEISGIRSEFGRTPNGSRLLILDTGGGPVRLAADDVEGWERAVLQMLEARVPMPAAGKGGHAADD